MRKKKSPVKHGIVFPRGFIKYELTRIAREKEIGEKLILVFQKYDLPFGDWKGLAIKLLQKYESELKPIEEPGRHRGSHQVWMEEVVANFLAEVARLKTEYPGIKDLQICKMLSYEGPFKGWTLESLRSQLRDLRRQGRLI